jgi:hypothetical protein
MHNAQQPRMRTMVIESYHPLCDGRSSERTRSAAVDTSLSGKSAVGPSGSEAFPPILDSRLASELLRCTVCEVQKLARAGIIPANRAPNGRWKFSRDALLEWSAGR